MATCRPGLTQPVGLPGIGLGQAGEQRGSVGVN
jgi:hypothetical protein